MDLLKQEKKNAKALHEIIERRQADDRKPELWAENWFFGVSGNVTEHISLRPVSDAYVGGVVTTFESYAKEIAGYTYRAYWVNGDCVHVLYDSHGAVWSICVVSLVWP